MKTDKGVNMKSTQKLFDNLEKDDFRKCKIDLQHAVDTIMNRRIDEKKKELLVKINKK